MQSSLQTQPQQQNNKTQLHHLPFDIILSIGQVLSLDNIISLYIAFKEIKITNNALEEALTGLIQKKTLALDVDAQMAVLANIARFIKKEPSSLISSICIYPLCKPLPLTRNSFGKIVSTLTANYSSLLYTSGRIAYGKEKYKKYNHIRKNKYMTSLLQECWLSHVLSRYKLSLIPFYNTLVDSDDLTPNCFEKPCEIFIDLCQQIPLNELIPALLYIHADAVKAYSAYNRPGIRVEAKKEVVEKLELKENILNELIGLFNKTVSKPVLVDFLVKNGVKTGTAMDIFLWYK
jgi:hypothetical protein